MDLYDHMKRQRPVLDKQKKFMFFGNHKAAMTSVNRGLLKNRVILFKENQDKYDSLFDNYPVDKAYKFTIVRNPFSRTPSAYFYTRGIGRIKINKKFKDFIKTDFKEKKQEIDIHFHNMHPNAFFEGKQFVDYIANLENINIEWKVIATRIKCPLMLPKMNFTTPRRFDLDDECIDIIRNIYKDDLKYFRYKFKGKR